MLKATEAFFTGYTLALLDSEGTVITSWDLGTDILPEDDEVYSLAEQDLGISELEAKSDEPV